MPPLEPEGGVGGLVLSVPFGYGYAVNEVISVPRACRRAFSCFICTARKCCSSSCHLMSSRASLERVEERLPTVLVSSQNPSEPCVEWTSEGTYDLGAMCRKPAELTAFRRLRRERKAELCGNSISSPYKHLNKCGYFSGSSSCNRRSSQRSTVSVSCSGSAMQALTCEYGRLDQLYKLIDLNQ